jgi:4-amino-4-deoxy-L-arabinose transferase-like glycosyltransferase
MERLRSQEKVWALFAIVVVIAILAAAICWSFAHPFGIHWDEAEYLNEVGFDCQRLMSGHLLGLASRIILKSWTKPPAYRILALPFLALFGFHATAARLASLACFTLSAWYIYLATTRIASRMAGIFAVLVFVLSPEIVSSSIFYSTDAPLYLATSAMLYYLVVCWSDTSKLHPANWIGLGLAVGLGFLSKTSFLAIAIPVLALWLVLSWRKYLGVPSIWSQRNAVVLALCVAAPWWCIHAKSAFAYVSYARGFVRNTLGPPSLPTWGRWLNTIVQGMLGHGTAILIALIIVACVIKVMVRKETMLDPVQKLVLVACICAGLPLVLTQLFATNPLLRHISPAVIPLAIVVGLLSDKSGWNHWTVPLVASAVLFFVQLIMIVTPVVFPNKSVADLGFVNTALPWRVMSRFDQWDWKPVRDISLDCNIQNPKISYLGGGRAFNPPQIEYPWVASEVGSHNITLDYPDVTWLWRLEDGAMDWEKLMEGADHSDLVVTAPHYIGETKYREDLDNQYNAEFAQRLSMDPAFRGPIRLEMGRFEPVEVELYVRKTLVCH